MRLGEDIDYEFLKLQLKKKWEKFKSMLFLMWFFGSIALMVISAEYDQNAISTCIFGHLITVFGFFAYGLNKNRPLKNKWKSLLAIFVGITIMIVCVLLYFEII